MFGRMGLTLLTANELANASNVAATIIMRAGVHPDFQMLSVSDDDLYRSASFQGSGLVRGLAGGCVCSCGGVHVASGLARGGLELPLHWIVEPHGLQARQVRHALATQRRRPLDAVPAAAVASHVSRSGAGATQPSRVCTCRAAKP